MSLADRRTGFHEGELAVQRRADVTDKAARLSGMLEPAELGGAIAAFLGELSLAVITARDSDGHLWTSPLTGAPGFLEVASASTLFIHSAPPAGDPLHRVPEGQPIGLIAIDFASRSRLRINGTLVRALGTGLEVVVEQAFGNCTKYIQRRAFLPLGAVSSARDDVRPGGGGVTVEDSALIRAADTFFLGTTHPDRGNDSSHRGGPPGFVRVEGPTLWWPDYVGNNLFNSFGNLAVDSTAAMLFMDFREGRILQLTGGAAVEWGEPGALGDDGHTGRRVRFTPTCVVGGRAIGLREVAHLPYPRNPPVTGSGGDALEAAGV